MKPVVEEYTMPSSRSPLPSRPFNSVSYTHLTLPTKA